MLYLGNSFAICTPPEVEGVTWCLVRGRRKIKSPITNCLLEFVYDLDRFITLRVVEFRSTVEHDRFSKAL